MPDSIDRARKCKRMVEGKARADPTLKNYEYYRRKIDEYIYEKYREEFWTNVTTDFAKIREVCSTGRTTSHGRKLQVIA